MFAAVVRHGTLVTVITLIVAILGAVAALRIPVQMIPDLDVRTITVETRWPGATPQDIEKDILIEQERYLRNIPGLAELNATATSEAAEIELEFPFGTDITEALIEVNNALSQVPDYARNVDNRVSRPPRFPPMPSCTSGSRRCRTTRAVWIST